MSRYDGSTRPASPSAEHQQVQHQQVQHQQVQHQQARHQAVLYAAGELPANETAQFESHLAQCPDCRLVIEEQRGIEAALADVPAERPSIATLDAISAAARRIPSHERIRYVEHDQSRAPRNESAFWRRLAGLGGDRAPAAGWALAAMILLAIGMYVADNSTVDVAAISQEALSWDYNIETTTSDEDLMTLLGDDTILSDSQWGSDDALSYDLVAIADEIDALAGTMQGF
jgi:hypothetical protein